MKFLSDFDAASVVPTPRRASITDERIRELIDIWERKFGEKLTAKEAALIGGRLISFYKAMIEGVARIEAKKRLSAASSQTAPGEISDS